MAQEIIVLFKELAHFTSHQYIMLGLAVLVAYIIGCFSPAIAISKLNGIDIKNEGSGNAGTTNVLRVLGAKAALATLIIDILKGCIAVKLGMDICGFHGAAFAAFAVIIGHIFPIFYKFKGGKGVATAFGAVLMINWPSAIAALILVLLAVGISRKMSVGSLVGAISYPLLILFYFPRFQIIGTIMALTLVLTHIPNIKRLKNKEEGTLKIGGINKDKEINEKQEVKTTEDQEDVFEIKEEAELVDSVEEGKLEFEAAAEETVQVESPVNYFEEVVIPSLKPRDRRKIAFLGTNDILTALANCAAYNGHNIMVWGEKQAEIAKIRDTRINEAVYPDILLSKRIQYTYHIMTAANKRHMMVVNGEDDTVIKQLKRISKKVDSNTIIVNTINNEEESGKSKIASFIKDSMNGNPYAELVISTESDVIIKNESAELIAFSDDKEILKEIKRVFGNEKINIKER